jgi:ABC-2 type transport system permease protein
MIFIVPILQMLLLVFAATFDMKRVDLVVVDNDMSTTSRELIAKYDGIPFFNVQQQLDVKSGEEKLLSDEADAILILPNNFEKELVRENKSSVQFLVNAIDGNSAQLVFSYSSSIIADYNKNIIAEWKGIPKFKAVSEIKITENYWYNPELDYKWYMAPGILAILVTIIGMFMSGMNLVREKEIGTIEQLNVTPMKKYQFIIGKLVPFWIIGLFDLAFGLLIAAIVFNLPIVGSIPVLFGFASIYLLGVLGLCLFI